MNVTTAFAVTEQSQIAEPRRTVLWLADQLRFTEEPSEATWPAITLDGEPTSWTLAEDRYTLLATEPLAPGTHTLTIPAALTDLAGTALATPNAFELDVPLTNATFVAYETPDPRTMLVEFELVEESSGPSQHRSA